MASTKVQRIMTQLINLIFRFLQSGFDEYMNLVLDDTEEVNIKKNTRKSLGKILLKGDNITPDDEQISEIETTFTSL